MMREKILKGEELKKKNKEVSYLEDGVPEFFSRK